MTNPSNTSSGESDERAAFEAWVRAYGSIFLERAPWETMAGEKYVNQWTQEAWVGWKARAALVTNAADSKPCASVTPELVYLLTGYGSTSSLSECDWAVVRERAQEKWDALLKAAALATQPAPAEVVAWMLKWPNHSPSFTTDKSDYVSWFHGRASYPDELIPLYATPPAAPAATEAPIRPAFTAEEIDKTVREVYIGEGPRGLMMLCKRLISAATPAPAVGASIEPVDCSHNRLVCWNHDQTTGQCQDCNAVFPGPGLRLAKDKWEEGYNAGRAGGISRPLDLHPATNELVTKFSDALRDKLYAAQEKYGYSDGWLQSDWMDECRAKLLEHVAKGDPRDVAAYCAFLWHHRESTAFAVGASVQPVPAKGLTVAEAMASTTMARYVDGRDQDQTTHQPVLASLSDKQMTEIARVAHAKGRLPWAGFKKDADDKYTIPILSASHVALVRAVLAALASSTPTKGGEAS